jgi:hypothetical protein
LTSGWKSFVERHEALSQTVELLAGSTRDLRAVVEAQIARDREHDEQGRDRRERDRQYLRTIADVLKHWANGDGESHAG